MAGDMGRGMMLGQFKRPSHAIMLVEENTDVNMVPYINDSICSNQDFSDDRHLGIGSRGKALVVYADGRIGMIDAWLRWNENSGSDEVFGIQ
jgi:hypothetical protein